MADQLEQVEVALAALVDEAGGPDAVITPRGIGLSAADGTPLFNWADGIADRAIAGVRRVASHVLFRVSLTTDLRAPYGCVTEVGASRLGYRRLSAELAGSLSTNTLGI
jgi:hypothetical protein